MLWFTRKAIMVFGTMSAMFFFVKSKYDEIRFLMTIVSILTRADSCLESALIWLVCELYLVRNLWQNDLRESRSRIVVPCWVDGHLLLHGVVWIPLRFHSDLSQSSGFLLSDHILILTLLEGKWANHAFSDFALIGLLTIFVLLIFGEPAGKHGLRFRQASSSPPTSHQTLA